MSLIADKVTVSVRESICKACPSWRKSLDQCKECGCLLKLKRGLKKQNCPLKKW